MKRRKLTTNGKWVLVSLALLTIIAGESLYISHIQHECSIEQTVEATAEYVQEAEPLQLVEAYQPEVRYRITEVERSLIERTITAEAAGQSLEGQMLVAQCILNAMEIDGYELSRVLHVFGYAEPKEYVTEQVKEAVSLVFDKGITVTDEPILYFYNPSAVTSTFHESQVHVITEGDHKFFKRK